MFVQPTYKDKDLKKNKSETNAVRFLGRKMNEVVFLGGKLFCIPSEKCQKKFVRKK
jgi:hypothetical protein